jgi:hypothetical protein
MILMPYNAILAGCQAKKDIEEETQEFSKCRVFLPSEYDRLNPIESEQDLK